MGALIGAAMGGVVDYRLARFAQRREAKAGARLTQGDLARAASFVKLAEDEGKWWEYFTADMPGWETHGSALAAELTTKEFEAVSQSVGELGKFGVAIQQAPRPPGQPYWVVERTTASLRGMREDATKAYNALARLAEQEKVEGRVLHDDQGA